MSIDTLTVKEFKKLPLVTEGESKEVRYFGDGKVVIRLKPTIYSYTHNRTGVVPGSDRLRLQSIRLLLPILEAAGISHTYKAVNDRWILSDLVLQPKTKSCPKPFRPKDMTRSRIKKLPKAPPIEVVVKAVHSGTPKHRYYKMNEFSVRGAYGGKAIRDNAMYPHTTVRFDWRNPMHDSNGSRLADEVMSEEMADWYMHTTSASATARHAFMALTDHLTRKGLVLWDICFFIDESGDVIFGEISPDCLRVRAASGQPLDKDIWRSGGSSTDVLKKWQIFVNILTTD